MGYKNEQCGNVCKELKNIREENEYMHMRLEEIRERTEEIKVPEEYCSEYRCVYERAIEEFREIVG